MAISGILHWSFSDGTPRISVSCGHMGNAHSAEDAVEIQGAQKRSLGTCSRLGQTDDIVHEELTAWSDFLLPGRASVTFGV